MKSGAYLPEDIYAIKRGELILGFVRASDAQEAYMKGIAVFGQCTAATQYIVVHD